MKGNKNAATDVMEHFDIAIIGAGPAGLSAAAKAAEYDLDIRAANAEHQPSHILIEGSPLHANTIQRYQKGKHVMDEPGYLDLRSPLEFTASKREHILGSWEQGISDTGINFRPDCEVIKISKSAEHFEICCADGSTISANNIVLAIGTQGNPRRLGIDGDNTHFVQYQLDDPDDYHNEDIIVVGAGDAAIENALALAKHNRVVIINRKSEFTRAKQGNLDNVLEAINDRNMDFSCRYDASVKSLSIPEHGAAGTVILNTARGDETLPCHRIIARLGSIPPRKFVENCGISLPNDDPEAIPELDGQYQSNVKGLYIIGALAGYPLIKQGMNQGFDVIEYIKGNPVKPVDHPLLALKFALLPYVADVDDILALYQQRVPMFSRMNALAFRELIMESNISYCVADDQQLSKLQRQGVEVSQQRRSDVELARSADIQRRKSAGLATKHLGPISQPIITMVAKSGDFIYRHNDYSNTFFTIIEGQVTLSSAEGSDTTLGAGQFFGEMSLLSGRPRIGNAVASNDTILIETPRRTMAKLMAANDEVAKGIETVFLQRTLQQFFTPKDSYVELRDIAKSVTTSDFNTGKHIYKEGDGGEHLYLIRSGTIALSRLENGREIAIGQLHSGQIFGQMALMGDATRRESAYAAVRSEVIKISRQPFLALLKKSPESISKLQTETSKQLKSTAEMAALPEQASLMSFLLAQGTGEGTNVLLIDENLCIGCDNCETACAETHKGISRLDRKAGVRFANINLPIACRHCEQPHCMKECPPNAIHRESSGEVYINDTCIGCGNCETNCPYNVIKMSYQLPEKPPFLSWLFGGAGPGPGEDKNATPSNAAKEIGKKAVKCDACVDRPAGPACVQYCPTGAAQRMGPADFINVLNLR
ncbi:cyclic nucleotide-binding domain-containing protein [Zhongshania sp.]|uniref:cyclic nucleotide-binding domain-containing protein n=1 Tax=Zhongshania sp. TaxID=1971902 RepID=UPI0039E6CC6E